jgi:hypothetical protein
LSFGIVARLDIQKELVIFHFFTSIVIRESREVDQKLLSSSSVGGPFQ